ncbi:hypothetical protein NS228_06485 [Methylobacterium indicum]|nr:hypothetical protein [Methylobacterium indicum]KTS25651.1 hypothetical protein NS229_19210 [Methylobacterium indicum]KTS41463.1 hypothetical protein NS228_06485 [Methylobacterium indicum]KTS51819.1 hypothetical protein NS230_13200 [Methylobacterium indicum]
MTRDDITTRPLPPATTGTPSLSEKEALAKAWDDRIVKLLDLLPRRVADAIAWLRAPSRRWVRIPAALLLILGGFLAVLPVFGLWMLPLGLALLSEDIPGMKPSLERAARWLEDKWNRLARRWRGSR